MRKVLFTHIILAALSAAGIWAYQRLFAEATNAPQEKREEHAVALPLAPAEQDVACHDGLRQAMEMGSL